MLIMPINKRNNKTAYKTICHKGYITLPYLFTQVSAAAVHETTQALNIHTCNYTGLHQII